MHTIQLSAARVCLLFLIYSSIFSAAAQAGNTAIEGRVFTESGPLPNALVSAHRTYNDLQRNLPPAASARTDKDGVYRLPLPPGAYHFTATGQSGGRSFFAYHGSNPITVAQENFWLALMATTTDPPPVYVDGSTGIEGRITYKGKPLDGAYLALYKPDDKTFKGLGVKTESVEADGRFKVNVEPGNYVVTARKIASGKSNRPLQKGDLYCYNSQNPVEVKDGLAARIEFSCYPKISRSDFVTTPTIKSDSIKTVAELAAASTSGIRGKVTDASGRPLAGMNVLAYHLTAPVFMMYHVYQRHEYSAETDEHGTFFIPIDADGEYGVVARDTLGDGPHRGELYGLYQGNVRHAVAVKRGELVENIAIVAGRVMDAPAQAQERIQPETVIGTPGGSPVILGDTVITHDTVWQGEIIIQGVINVKRGATLTIRPVTVVRFKKIDRDQTSVCDREYLIEGRLIARGSADKQISFTSAEKNPALNDWSYLQFLAADRGNIVEYCRFEYAFAGVMIHYAEVRISDSVFQHNNRGVHYNTADLGIDHCTFRDNRIGIRFMRLEGSVLITNNEISRNDLGVLFVRQHVNAVDFERLNRGTEMPRFAGNNIFDNVTYNFSLGEGQERDVNVAGNWWGTAKREAIAERMFDRRKDESLSTIVFEPFIIEPVRNCGVRGLRPSAVAQAATEKVRP